MQHERLDRRIGCAMLRAPMRHSVVILGLAVLGCSSSKPGFETNKATGPNGSQEANQPGNELEIPVAGDAGKQAVCSPDPRNYDIPANNCDDDGDGAVDNLPTCDNDLPFGGSAAQFAQALGLCQQASDTKWGIVSAAYTNSYESTREPPAEQHGILKKFGNVVRPREGASLGVLSTGHAREYDGTSGTPTFKRGVPMSTSMGRLPPGYPKVAGGCGSALINVVWDVITVKLKIKAPKNAKGVAFDFSFWSGEWPEYVCSNYNDGFIAFLRSNAFNNGRPENISFDGNNDVISVNAAFFDRCTPNTTTGCRGRRTATAACPGGEADLAGTGFEAFNTYCSTRSTGGGTTGWLSSKAPIEPGETIELEFMIGDTGDPAYDSSVLLDNLRFEPTDVQVVTERPVR